MASSGSVSSIASTLRVTLLDSWEFPFNWDSSSSLRWPPNSSCFYQYSSPLRFLFLITPVPIPQHHLSVMSILFLIFKGRFMLLGFSGSVYCSMVIIYFKANIHLKVKKVHATYTSLTIFFFLLFHLFPTFVSFCFIPVREGRNHHFKLYINAYSKSVVRQQWLNSMDNKTYISIQHKYVR